jgi:hypothetical protein
MRRWLHAVKQTLRRRSTTYLAHTPLRARAQLSLGFVCAEHPQLSALKGLTLALTTPWKALSSVLYVALSTLAL